MGILGLVAKGLGIACAVESTDINMYAWVAQWTFQQGEAKAGNKGMNAYVQKKIGEQVEIMACDNVMNNAPSAAVLNGTTYMFCQNSGALYYSSCTPGASSPDTEVPTTTVPSGIPSAVVFNGDLYVFYESVGQLGYSVFNGTSWSSGTVSGTSMTESPSAVVFNGGLYVFYMGSNGSTIQYVTFNGTTWSAQVQPPIGGGSASPVAVVFNKQLYVFYQGGGYSGGLFFNTFNGSSWTSNTQVSNVGMSCSPSAVVLNNDLYVVHQGGGDNGQLWYNTFNGSSWAGDTQVSGVTMQDSPCAVVMNNEVWAICSQPDNAGMLVYFSLTSPSAGGVVPAQPNAYGPSVVTYNGVPYLFYLGPGSVGQLWSNVFVGSSHWTPSLQAANMATLDPSATGGIGGLGPVVFDGEPYVFYSAYGQLWYSVFTYGAWVSQTVPNVSISSFPWPVVYNSELYVFYTSGSSGTEICYSVFNGTSWGAEVAPSVDGASNSPAAVVYAPPGSSSAQIYLFYQGTGNNSGSVYYNVFDGSSWTSSTLISNTSLSYSPSAVAFNGDIYLIYEGPGGDAQLRYNIFNGSTWSNYTQVSGVSTYNRPWPVVYGDQILVFYHSAASAGGIWSVPLFNQGIEGQEVPCESGGYVPVALAYNNAISVFYLASSNEQIVYYNVYSGNSLWTPPIQGPLLSRAATGGNPGLSQSPSAVLFNNQPYVFYNGGGALWYSIFNGSSWSSAQVSGISLSQSPGAVIYTPSGSSSASIYVFYQGANQNLYYVTYNGSSWSSAAQVSETALAGSPSAVVFNGDIYVVHTSSGGSALYYNVFNGSSWAGDTAVSGVDLTGSPCTLVLSSTQLGVCFMASGGSGALEYVVLSGGSWSSAQTIPNAIAGGSPAAAVFDGVGYVVYEGTGNTEGVLMYTMLSEGEWSVPSFTGGVSMGGTASLLEYTPPGYPAAQLFIFHGDAAQDGNLWNSQCSPSSGQQNIEVATNGATSGPSATVFNDCLYVFYEGSTSGNTNGEIKYVTFNGAVWGTEAQVSGAGSSMYGPTGPSATVFNNQIYVFYQGGSGNGTLWYCASSNGSSWGSQVQVIPPGASSSTWLMSYSPAAVAFGHLYVFYAQTGGGTEPICYCSSANGTNWSTATLTTLDVSTSASPAAFVSEGALNLLYTQGADFYDMYSSNGLMTSWSEPIEYTPFISLAGNPSAVVLNGQLYIFTQMYSGSNLSGNWGNNQLWYTISGGTDCSWNLLVNNVYIAESPSAVAFTPSGASSPSLYVFHQGSSSGELCYSTFNGSTWAADVQISGVSNLNSSTSPSALVFNGNLYVFYQGGGGQLYYVASSNGSSWSGPTQIIPSGYNSGSVFVGNSPSAVLYNGEIYVFFEGPNNNQQIWYVQSSNASAWTQSTVSNVDQYYTPNSSPAAVVYNDDLYVFYQAGGTGKSATGILYYNRFNGSSWSDSVQPIAAGKNPLQDDYANIYGSPAPVVYNGQLYLYFGNLQCTGQLWCAVFNGSSWSAIEQISVQNNLTLPSVPHWKQNLGSNFGSISTAAISTFWDILDLKWDFGNPWTWIIKPGPLIP